MESTYIVVSKQNKEEEYRFECLGYVTASEIVRSKFGADWRNTYELFIKVGDQ